MSIRTARNQQIEWPICDVIGSSFRTGDRMIVIGSWVRVIESEQEGEVTAIDGDLYLVQRSADNYYRWHKVSELELFE